MESVDIKINTQLSENLDFTQLSQTDFTEEDRNEGPKCFTCTHPNCNKTFRYQSEIERHIVTHTTTRAFVCSYKDCNKGFKRADALATHLRVHTGDKPFKCPVGSCQTSFSTKAGLRYHILKHKNDKLHKCDYPGCDQSFLTLSQLKQHKRGAKVHEALQSTKVQDSEMKCVVKELHDFNDHAPWYHPCSNEYEPPVQKRVQYKTSPGNQLAASASSKQIQQLSLAGMNIKSIPSEKIESNPMMTQLFPHTSQANAITYNQPLTIPSQNYSTLDLPQTPNLYPLKIVKESSEELNLPKTGLDEQAKLLKSINKVLDENMALKRHLEICQKIISIYQANLGDIKDTSLLLPFKDIISEERRLLP